MRHIWTRIRRKPIPCIAIFLLCAVITEVLCGLRHGTIAAQAHYQEICREIDVRCTVTNLAGDRSDRLSIYESTLCLFTGEGDKDPEFTMLLEDVQIKGSTKFYWNGEAYTLSGITSTRIAPPLWPDNGCTISWNEGMGEDIFAGGGSLCIIPKKLAKTLQDYELPEEKFSFHLEGEYPNKKGRDWELEIAGIHQGKDEHTIYCPWKTYRSILRNMGRRENADSLFATLIDNRDLPRFRKIASKWFAEPDVNAAGRDESNGRYLALDINDSQLKQAEQTLQNSMRVNRIAAVLVFLLSAGAGALVGFLTIRNRKREIALMRILGTSDIGIFAGYSAEQIGCVILGTMAGGAYFGWKPLYQLCLFAVLYFAGLSAALWMFLHKNLLVTMKEEE